MGLQENLLRGIYAYGERVLHQRTPRLAACHYSQLCFNPCQLACCYIKCTGHDLCAACGAQAIAATCILDSFNTAACVIVCHQVSRSPLPFSRRVLFPSPRAWTSFSRLSPALARPPPSAPASGGAAGREGVAGMVAWVWAWHRSECVARQPAIKCQCQGGLAGSCGASLEAAGCGSHSAAASSGTGSRGARRLCGNASAWYMLTAHAVC